jgi:hypothetical protein
MNANEKRNQAVEKLTAAAQRNKTVTELAKDILLNYVRGGNISSHGIVDSSFRLAYEFNMHVKQMHEEHMEDWQRHIETDYEDDVEQIDEPK